MTKAASSELPRLNGTRIEPLKIQTLRIEQMKQMIADLTREKNEYKISMQHLIKNTEDVIQANISLEKGINDRKSMIENLQDDLQR